MRLEYFRSNGKNYTRKGCGFTYPTIEPFSILVPVTNLEWMRSKKHSFVMRIVGEQQFTGKAWIYGRVPVKQVTIKGSADSVQAFMEEIGVDWSEEVGYRDCWCPNKWQVITRNDRSLRNNNPNRYLAYYITMFRGEKVIDKVAVDNPRSVLNCPKWNNARKIHICQMF